MRALPSFLRKQLETSVLAARRAAEAASRAAIESLGVFADRRPEHLDSAQAALRNGLRAKWRQLGNDRDLLVAECAYEQWHQLLFARFLAENGLLLHPQFRAPVTLAECEELAADLGEPDAWTVAARFAAEILPGIFRLDDPCVRLRLAPEGRHELEQILDAIPAETFIADDALGWVYQFWQKDKKDEVNASERKIGGADLGPVTQLFTENYMVRFLLENSLGAWWAARHPDSQLAQGFDYLRFDDNGKPAAGTFEGWPDRVAEVTVMDPCCGSGHFLVEAFSMLSQMRAEEEELAPVEAQDAVLRDNLFGLELDPRCVQIAMFNVALQAWKVGGEWRQLPVPNIACSGIPVKAPVEEWKALARGDERIESALVRLHILFREADTLGSLIDPKRVVEISDPTSLQTSLEDVEWTRVAPLLTQIGAQPPDPALAVLGSEAAGIARAADLLSRRYICVATNVPYLSKNGHGPLLRDFLSRQYHAGVGDLGVAFHSRLIELTRGGGSVAAVLPVNWLILGSYEKHRRQQLHQTTWAMLAVLGARAFSGISGEVVRVCLLIGTRRPPDPQSTFAALDASAAGNAEKGEALKMVPLTEVLQAQQLSNPDARVLLTSNGGGELLEKFVGAYTGTQTGDFARYGRKFWELLTDESWVRQMTTVPSTTAWSGRENMIRWDDGRGPLSREPGAYVRGRAAWGRPGVLVSRMGDLPCTLYAGEFFDDNCGVLVPTDPTILSALWAFTKSPDYRAAVRAIDDTIKVTNKTLAKVPFDIEHWRRVADEIGPLPEPWSDDPTQWLFAGRPKVSTAALQVAVARLVGYRWPEQPESDDLDKFADADGIVCLPAVAGEPPAADRVQQLFAGAFRESWTPARIKELLERAESRKSLAEWLRDEFFKQHCSLFGNRPFVWHIWDGQRDGFSALVNYHRFDRKTLEKLTYTYLGQDWVERQRAEVRDGVAGAEARLAAAFGLQKKLEAIREGEAPLDIYVRWKEIHEQSIGWEPDLNDGVRLNIRPFVEAGVLRAPFNIHWRKDRGKNTDGTERVNDIHLTLAQKLAARRKAGQA
jgi:Putative RNA methylase family UPF0020